MPVTDQFEIHLTLDVAHAADRAADLARLASERGLGLLQIELPRGAAPVQPMLGWRRDGALADCMADIGDVERALAVLGIRTVRAKIEAAPWNVGVPQAGECCPPGTYFESHLKLLLDDDHSVAVAADIAIAHGGHVSRNARRMREDGRQERFVTLRSTENGLPGIQAQTQALHIALSGRGIAILDAEIEFVVHDSHRALDAGWLSGEDT